MAKKESFAEKVAGGIKEVAAAVAVPVVLAVMVAVAAAYVFRSCGG